MGCLSACIRKGENLLNWKQRSDEGIYNQDKTAVDGVQRYELYFIRCTLSRTWEEQEIYIIPSDHPAQARSAQERSQDSRTQAASRWHDVRFSTTTTSGPMTFILYVDDDVKIR